MQRRFGWWFKTLAAPVRSEVADDPGARGFGVVGAPGVRQPLERSLQTSGADPSRLRGAFEERRSGRRAAPVPPRAEAIRPRSWSGSEVQRSHDQRVLG